MQPECCSPDVQPDMSPVLTVSGGMGVVPDMVTGRAFRSQVLKPTPMLPSASASRLGYRHPSLAPHLHYQQCSSGPTSEMFQNS